MGTLIGSDSSEGSGCQSGSKLSYLLTRKQKGWVGPDSGFYNTPFLRAPKRSQRTVSIPFKGRSPLKTSY